MQEVARRSISAAGLPAAIERQAAAAVDEADALIFVVDGQASSASGNAEQHPATHVEQKLYSPGLGADSTSLHA